MNRYENISVVKNERGIRYYKANIYPHIQPTDEDIYMITTAGDRYDLLAYQYYKDKTLWWIIPIANQLNCDTLSPQPGLQIRIPANVQAIIKDYRDLNIG